LLLIELKDVVLSRYVLTLKLFIWCSRGK